MGVTTATRFWVLCLLYLELQKEELRPDPTSPTGQVRAIVPSGYCAVFDEAELDKVIIAATRKLRELKRIKQEAKDHTHMVSEDYLRDFKVPFTVKRLVRKRC